MTLGTARIIRGDALHLSIADNSVDVCITSPPYFGLRSYQDGGSHYEGQIGAEPTPAEFVDALIAATAEMMRCLKPSGSIFVNLGDKYAGSGGGGEGSSDGHTGRHARPPRRNVGVPTKSLIGVPWRYALRCIDELGLILRAEIIWSKPNGLPESVTDRVRRSHETWFHFTVQPRYFSAIDEIRETYSPNTSWKEVGRYQTEYGDAANTYNGGAASGLRTAANPLGKLPGSVWSVPTQPLRVPPELGIDHFAAFPMHWPRQFIQGWSPSGVCTVCGEGRRPAATAGALVPSRAGDVMLGGDGEKYAGRNDGGSFVRMSSGQGFAKRERTLTGYACGCPEPTAPAVPATILDPFGGTGTTALVAKALGRHGISNDMSADYCRLATWRTNDPGELASALQVEKPEAVHPDQLDLFGGEFQPEASTKPSGGLAMSKARGQDCIACGYRMQYASRDTCEKCGAPRA